MLYDDGERAFESLSGETVRWVLGPGAERTSNGERKARLPAAARRRAAEDAEAAAVAVRFRLTPVISCRHSSGLGFAGHRDDTTLRPPLHLPHVSMWQRSKCVLVRVLRMVSTRRPLGLLASPLL